MRGEATAEHNPNRIDAQQILVPPRPHAYLSLAGRTPHPTMRRQESTRYLSFQRTEGRAPDARHRGFYIERRGASRRTTQWLAPLILVGNRLDHSDKDAGRKAHEAASQLFRPARAYLYTEKCALLSSTHP